MAHGSPSERGEPAIDPVNLRRAEVLSAAGGAFALGIGATGLAGWTFDLKALNTLSQGVTMKANTALCLAMAGAALLALRAREGSRVRRIAGYSLASLVALAGAATLSQHIVGWDLGIDQLLFQEPDGAVATTSPNRMGPHASLSLLLLGLALLGLDRTTSTGVSPSQVAAAFVGATVLLPTLGYLSGAQELYGIAQYTGIAAHTALTLIVLAGAVFLARPLHRPATLLIQDDAGGRLARTLLPATVLAPLLIQLALGMVFEQSGAIDVAFGRALLLLLLVVLFAVLVWSAATRLSAESHARDRAERTSAEMLERERVARGEAVRSAQLKDDFVATVSHELRTPLNAILGWASILRAQGTDAARVDRGLTVIERNARLQARLIDDLLDMSRITSGKIRVDVQPTELCALVRSVIGSHTPAIEAKGLSLTESFDEPSILVQADPARMQQIVWNLISNALKFTPKGGRVSVRVRRLDGRAQVQVADTGAGIAAEFLPHVFERFRQGDSSITRKHGGLGLGLSIARTLAEMHGGTLRAESDGPGHGATFTVELPVASVDVRAPEAAGAAGAVASEGRLAGVSLLLVEDDEDARELLKQVLSELGASVTGAPDAAHALEQLDAARPDVLITDIGLPGQDGYALLGHVRERPDGAELPAIALTAFARAEDKRRALSAGFQEYLTKPVNFEALFRAIEALARPRVTGRTSR